ncbi:MAG: hypothetical protein M1273_08745 [Deltaproteobacteria bacterium]|jgi:hypothetical protein|nr:hypothetical protein [Deltaproteobacteria bacterium]
MDKINKEYDFAIIIFLDILGFKDIINKGKKPEEIEKYLEPFKDMQLYLSEIIDIKFNHPLKSYYFSDLLVISVPMGKTNEKFLENLNDDERGDVRLELSVILEFLYMFLLPHVAKYNVLIRGSITIGEIYLDINEKEVFGKGLIRAYELEKDFAIYPRVVIDPEVSSKLYKFDVESAQKMQDLVSIDDGIWFIDYLNPKQLLKFLKSKKIKKLALEPLGYQNYCEVLKDHRELIMSNLGDIKGFDKNLIKIYWLIKYHNNSVRSLSKHLNKKYNFNTQDLLVSEGEKYKF